MVKVLFILAFLILCAPNSHLCLAAPTAEFDTLSGTEGVSFGMSQKEVIQSIIDGRHFKPGKRLGRPEYTVLEFNRREKRSYPLDGIRVFVHPEDGVFWIEEEIDLRWNLQRPARDNREDHQMQLTRVLGKLRNRYGREELYEETDPGSRFAKDDFVTATWSFPDHRWVHVIYEPQDWGIHPEMNKILVIYRDSGRDPRSAPNSFSSSKR